MSNVMYETKLYDVIRVDNPEASTPVLCEDGEYSTTRSGYAVVNKENGNIEHTTIMLPGAIFQAMHFSDTLDSLINPPEIEAVEGEVIDLASVNVPEDVVPS